MAWQRIYSNTNEVIGHSMTNYLHPFYSRVLEYLGEERVAVAILEDL